MPPFAGLLVGVLAVWRVTHLLWAEDGPAEIFARFRRLFGAGFFGRVLDCFNCLSLWVAAPAAYVLCSGWQARLLAWLALSGGAILLERATAVERKLPPTAASWHEEQELEMTAASKDEEESHVMLR